MPFGVLELPDDLLAYLLSFLQNENKETLPLLRLPLPLLPLLTIPLKPAASSPPLVF